MFLLWTVTDCRQKSDLKYFKTKFAQKTKTVRIIADETVRVQRGWKFIPGLFANKVTCSIRKKLKTEDFQNRN